MRRTEQPWHLEAIAAFVLDQNFNEAVRAIDQKLNVTCATLVKIPFDLDYWRNIASQKFPNGLPEPFSDDPTQWLFHGHPAAAMTGTGLHVALARLAGYRWPSESDVAMQLSDEARAWIAKTGTFAARQSG